MHSGQASLISLHVTLPVVPLVNVREAEFPVLARLINALEESLSLLVLRQVEEDLDDPGAVTVKMLLQIHDGTIPLLPNGLLVEQLIRKPLTAENLRMHANDEHLLIVGTIEDADPPAFRQTAGRAPKKIVLQFLGTRLLETENLAALRINPGHDVPDGAILACSVHPLKNQQQRIAVGRVVKALQRAQLLNVFSQEFLYRFFDLQKGFTIVGHSLSLTFSPGRTRKSFALILIFILSAMSAAFLASVYL